MYDPITLSRMGCEQIFEPSMYNIEDKINMYQAKPAPDKSVGDSSMQLADKINQLSTTTAISSLTFDPINIVLAGNRQGLIKAIGVVKQQVQYAYLDLGNRDFCTVTLDKK